MRLPKLFHLKCFITFSNNLNPSILTQSLAPLTLPHFCDGK